MSRYIFRIQLSFSFLFYIFSYLYLLIVEGSILFNYTVNWLVIHIHIYPNNFALHNFDVTWMHSLNPETWNPISLDRVGRLWCGGSLVDLGTGTEFTGD